MDEDKPITDRDNFPKQERPVEDDTLPNTMPGMLIRFVPDPRFYHSGYRDAMEDVFTGALIMMSILLIAFVTFRRLDV